MDMDALLSILSRLRRATVGTHRAPHKPLLLLWLFARFNDTGTSATAYSELEQPVSDLINEFGPPVVSPAAAGQRAAMPFVHLERELWNVHTANGEPLSPDTPERRRTLLDLGARGQLRPEVEALLAVPANLAAATRLLLQQHFTPILADLILDSIGLDVTDEPTGRVAERRRRDASFAELVKRAYAYRCAMCGFDGALGRVPVALEAAHVQWHSQHGPDEVVNGVCLCELHHALFDLGVIGLTPDHTITVSPLYVARSAAGRAVGALAGTALISPMHNDLRIDLRYIHWHTTQVFKIGHRAA